MKIKVKHIIIDRAEGLTTECGPREVTTFKQANNLLSIMCQTAPKNGCYDKTDFKIIYEDGEEYQGRLDLQHPSYAPMETLEGHVTFHCRFYGGLIRDNELPSHLTPEKYRKFVSQYSSKELLDFHEFLEKYQLED